MTIQEMMEQIRPCNYQKPYIFISYSSQDKEHVLQDAVEFQRRGYNLWIDDRNLDKTKPSWKNDALAAIEDYNCQLLVFYVSENSLISEACYNELMKTLAEETQELHLMEPVKIICIDVNPVDNIILWNRELQKDLQKRTDLDRDRKVQGLKISSRMIKQFFNSNNERVRVHSRNEAERSLDYYDEIVSSFPKEALIYQPKEQVKPEPDLSASELYRTAENYSSGTNGVQKDERKAGEYFLKAAQAGHGLSMNKVGYFYNTGTFGFPKSDRLAREWYLKAAEAGNKFGLRNTAAGYRYGNYGFEKDEIKAGEYYRKAAEAGHAGCMNEMGYFHERGIFGYPKDIDEAGKWYKKAADAGDKYGLRNTAVGYRYGSFGIEKDEIKAGEYYRKAAEAGHAGCMNEMGYFHEKGIFGYPKDMDEAGRWYLKAAEAGDKYGMRNTAVGYQYGNFGFEKDELKALGWYFQAADAGNTDAMRRLGMAYLNGDLTLVKDRKEAEEWLKKASDGGDAEAKKQLESLQ